MFDVSDEALNQYAKTLVVNCVRNTFLEEIHSGNASLGNKEIKQLMKEIANKVFTFLKHSNDPQFMAVMSIMHPHDWDTAELDEDFLVVLGMSKGQK